MIDYGNILSVFYAHNKWRIEDCFNFNTLKWMDESPKPTREELDSKWEETRSIYKKINCKIRARQLLADSDWSETPSTVEQLENADEWKTYRMEVRKFIITPVEHPEFPSKPQTKWKV